MNQDNAFEQQLLEGALRLDDVLLMIWGLLEEGTRSRKTAMHLPVIATVDADGAPQARTVVLRRVDRTTRMIGFNTDQRSFKVAEIKSQSCVSALFYDPAQKTQIRAQGSALVHHQDSAAEAAWAQATNLAKRCYSCAPGPGTQTDGPTSGLPAALLDMPFDAADVAGGYENFAVVEINISQLDWLYLTVDGNRAARFQWSSGGTMSASWQIP